MVDLPLCKRETPYGLRSACIYQHKPDISTKKEGDTWTCPTCGEVWTKIKNTQHLFTKLGKHPRYVWTTGVTYIPEGDNV